MALKSGINIPEITLFIFGGVSRLSEDAKDPETEFKIAIVGPISSLFLAGLFKILETFFQSTGLPLMTAIFGYLAWINVVLAIFNLIPGFPLDGGRVLRAFLWWKSGSMSRATKVASDFGKGFATVLMLLGAYQIFSGMLIGGMWMVFIGVFLRGVAEGGYQEVVMRQALEGVQIREVMVENVITVPPDVPISKLITRYFLHYGYKGFPVEQEGTIMGIVSLANIRGIPEEEQSSRTVQQVMTPIDNNMVVSPEVSLAEALKIMSQTDMGRLLVMREGRMVGIITKTGLLRLLEIKQILNR
jgi:Zn-dependent protease/predicted transcriptional regulator